MRVAALCLLSACAAWPQFRSTVPLVVAPTSIRDAKGHFVNGLDAGDLVLYDNNVKLPIQVEFQSHPISLVVAVESSRNSGPILAKLGDSGILFSELLAADAGETALLSFSDEVKLQVDFTKDPDDLAHELKRIHVEGGGAATLDALMRALEMLAHRKPGRRLIVLMIAETRDRSSRTKLPQVVQEVQRLNAAIYWLTYSTFLAPYTNRKFPTAGDLEEPGKKGTLYKKKDDTPVIPGNEPMDLLTPFFELAHLIKPNIPNLFTRVTGARSMFFLTKSNLEQAIHEIGDEVHSEYLLTFQPPLAGAGLFHTIRVEVKGRPDLKARTREGYWAVQ